MIPANGIQVVFGGAGLLGQALVRRLLISGSSRVIIFDAQYPDSALSNDPRVTIQIGNILELDQKTIIDVVEDA